MSGGQQDGQWLSGIEIALDPGFKTYWRSAGDSGLPPRFDWSGSDNVASADIKWPAPSRHEDAGGAAYVYHDRVILPVLVKPMDETKPIKLSLSVDYGVCKDICIPAHADIVLPLNGDQEQKAILEKVQASLPRSQALGAPGDLSVLSVEPQTADKPGLKVKVRVPSGGKPALFAEGPDDWYLSTSLPDAENSFIVTIEEKPKDAAGPIQVLLTLVAGEEAIETEVKLDASRQPR
ncbi:protein-disulfide reductase DsbD domain-containing protein [Microvirga sp. 2TAF3]|uniref:protein-disulfide reductase DsbD domain-containing protein n=1 Tax=Microvirga sp. 2TAF3 TaxID=3233014 RepID=UPI003F96EE33